MDQTTSSVLTLTVFCCCFLFFYKHKNLNRGENLGLTQNGYNLLMKHKNYNSRENLGLRQNGCNLLIKTGRVGCTCFAGFNHAARARLIKAN